MNLDMNLLFELVQKYQTSRSDLDSEYIEKLYSRMKYTVRDEPSFTLKDEQTLEDVYQHYQTLKNSSPQDPKTREVLRLYKVFRGLLFDLKTRFEYMSPDVAIQDSLNIVDHCQEVFESLAADLEKVGLGTQNLDRKKALLAFSKEFRQLSLKVDRDHLKELYQEALGHFDRFQAFVDP